MDKSQIIVTVIGLASIVWVVWYFWIYQKKGTAVTEVAGVQEVNIMVKGGYSPDTIIVKQGEPVRLNFTRQEAAMCSEMVVFDKIDKSAELPEGKTISIEFTPGETGEIPFQCQMGMFRGKVVVTV